MGIERTKNVWPLHQPKSLLLARRLIQWIASGMPLSFTERRQLIGIILGGGAGPTAIYRRRKACCSGLSPFAALIHYGADPLISRQPS